MKDLYSDLPHEPPVVTGVTRSLNNSEVSAPSPLRANQGDSLRYVALGFYLLSLGEYRHGFRGPLWFLSGGSVDRASWYLSSGTVLPRLRMPCPAMVPACSRRPCSTLCNNGGPQSGLPSQPSWLLRHPLHPSLSHLCWFAPICTPTWKWPLLCGDPAVPLHSHPVPVSAGRADS